MFRRIAGSIGVLVAAVVMSAPASARASLAPQPAASSSSVSSLDLAFRLATAIRSDPKDQAKAQEAVIRDFLLVGETEEARKRADQVQGWRRGVLYAEVAESEARKGNTGAARDLLEMAHTVQSDTSGWESLRIRAQIAEALAELGEVKVSRGVSEELSAADSRQYAGRSAATVAKAEAMGGSFAKAMEALHPLDGDTDVEIAGGRTHGYLELARIPQLTPAQRLEASQATERSAENLPPWERVSVMTEIAQTHQQAGRAQEARRLLQKAEQILATQQGGSSGLLPLVADVARSWGRIGEKARGRSLLRKWEGAAAAALDIDRPAAFARLASASRALAEPKQAERLLSMAVSSAESLRNARPRALSAVEICRTLGRDGVDPGPETRRRLEALLRNLKDPW